MNESVPGLPPDLSPDYQGIPETVGGPPPGVPGDNADDAFPLPGDSPQVALGRTTAAEGREGETLDERLLQEQPDVMQADPEEDAVHVISDQEVLSPGSPGDGYIND